MYCLDSVFGGRHFAVGSKDGTVVCGELCWSQFKKNFIELTDLCEKDNLYYMRYSSAWFLTTKLSTIRKYLSLDKFWYCYMCWNWQDCSNVLLLFSWCYRNIEAKYMHNIPFTLNKINIHISLLLIHKTLSYCRPIITGLWPGETISILKTNFSLSYLP